MNRPSQIKDFYGRLELAQDASPIEIKSAYKRLASRWHPDHNPGKEEESRLEFIAASEAYEKLSSEGRRIVEEDRSRESEEDYDIYNLMFEAIGKVDKDLEMAMRMFMPLSPGLSQIFSYILRNKSPQ